MELGWVENQYDRFRQLACSPSAFAANAAGAPAGVTMTSTRRATAGFAGGCPQKIDAVSSAKAPRP
jgi:hypothetical protein